MCWMILILKRERLISTIRMLLLMVGLVAVLFMWQIQINICLIISHLFIDVDCTIGMDIIYL